jgi:DNA-binding NarL/FixJ family response regulator
MSMAHYCLSSRISQLLRWQQAFPEGRVASSLEKLLNSIGEKTIVWVHSDCLSPGTFDETISRLTRHQDVHRVVVISCLPSVQETATALAAGATGYCHALATPELFGKIATVVSNGGFWVGEEFIGQLAGNVARSLAPTEPLPEPAILGKLSTREREVALQVKKGASNKEIATALVITERTVKAHLGSIFQKLEIRDRLQLSLLLSHNPS